MGKKFLNYYVLFLITVLICIGSLNYIVDPLLYYQRPERLLSPLYTEDLRFLIPGLIKNSPDHNAVIMGTSMAANFIASETGRTINETTVKLTIDGGTYAEQTYVLSKYLDAHPDANKVIWGIDPLYMDNDPNKLTLRPYVYPHYLYDDDILNFKYLLNYTVTLHSLQTIASNLLSSSFYMKTSDLDSIQTWPEGTPTGCRQVMANYNALSSKKFDIIDPFLMPIPFFNKKHAAANLNKIIELAKKRKDVQFYLFLPPYSIVRFLFENERHGLERLLEARNLFADMIKETGNMYVVDMQATEDIINNLDYYMDMLHHNRTISNFILENIVNRNFDDLKSILKNSDKIRAMARKADFEAIKQCGQETP